MADKKYLDLNGLGYTIRKMDNKKADIESPALTGTPTAPTAASGTATPQIATTEFVNNELKDKQDKLIAGNNITIDEETNTISSSDVTVTPARTSGTKIGDITVDGTKKTFYISSTYLDKSSTARNDVAGQIYVGSCSTNVSNAFTHQRDVTKVSGGNFLPGTPYVGATFAVSSDGSASFQHKTFTSSAGAGARNAAILRFYGKQDGSNGALQFAVNTTNTTMPSESDYKDVAFVDDIPKFVTLTQEEYNLLSSPDEDTFYVIVE